MFRQDGRKRLAAAPLLEGVLLVRMGVTPQTDGTNANIEIPMVPVQENWEVVPVR